MRVRIPAGGLRAALAASALAASALAATPALADGPGLPRSYDVIRVDSPEPLAGGAFGWGVASADLTKDGKADLLVAQAQFGPGQIFIFDGATGAHVDTIDPPEQNSDGSSPTLGFVYVEAMPDIGSCPTGDGDDADEICDAGTIGNPDGVPEIIVGARSMEVSPGGAKLGRGYVFDGATRAVLKRIDMPAAERPGQAGAQFGRMMMVPQGLEPCAGIPSENNALGVGACPDVPAAVRLGDVNGGGQPDIVITARSFKETGDPDSTGPLPQADPDSQCRAVGAASCTSGKAWVYAGEDIVGTDPQAILDTALYSVQNPYSQTGGAEFGGNVFRTGDVYGAGNPPDGTPDFVIAARNLDYPLDDPAEEAWDDAGAAFLVDGATGKVARTITSPLPQPRSQFSGSFNSGRPTGDLGATTTSDFLLPAPLQNGRSTDDGMAWVFNGEASRLAGGGATGSWQFATLYDPTPMIGGNFGGATTGVGDLVTDADAPANEVLVGGFNFDPSTEASNNNVADLHFLNATMERNLQTVPHPDGARGDGFGVGLTPMGDLNGDGFLDFAASAYLANVELAGQGRAYIFTSNDTPAPAAPPAPPKSAPPPAAPQPDEEPETVKPGRCANELTGTRDGERLSGGLGGDRIFALGGADRILGHQGEDCIAAGAGNDVVDAGADSDRVTGGSGRDRLRGFDGHDRLFGGKGRDHIGGDFGRDTLAGGPGNDTLLGGPDGDRLFGEGGSDRIVASDGRNYIDGGSGGDFIQARNGERDTIRCGRGRDTVVVDRKDLLSRCERVRRSAG